MALCEAGLGDAFKGRLAWHMKRCLGRLREGYEGGGREGESEPLQSTAVRLRLQQKSGFQISLVDAPPVVCFSLLLGELPGVCLRMCVHLGGSRHGRCSLALLGVAVLEGCC